MYCPLCKDKSMITLELDEVEVDFCLECKGIWLDKGEMEMLLDSPRQALELLNSFAPAQTSEVPNKCPICLKKMEKISVSSSQPPLVIDNCPRNHGLWFDKGELPLILEKANLDSENKVQKLLKEMFAQNS